MTNKTRFGCRVAILSVTLFACSTNDFVASPPRTPADITGISQAFQLGLVGRATLVRPAVKVTDQNGAPLPGVTVRFTFHADVPLPGSSSLTDDEGIATVPEWILSGQEFENSLTAYVSPLPPVTFMARAVRSRLIAKSSSHTCAISSAELQKVYYWGAGRDGRLGNGDVNGRLVPEAVSSGLPFVSISVNDRGACGLERYGSIWCWGDGQLRPVLIASGSRFVLISMGDTHDCALNVAGEAFCWGRNNAGQLGDGTLTDRAAPTLVGGGHVFISIVAGFQHSCGVERSGAGYCWGLNDFGQLGDGTVLNRATPVAVQGAHTFLAIEAAGRGHTCGVSPQKAAFCWGANTYGGLGDGTRTSRLVPVAVSGGNTFWSLSAEGEGDTWQTCGTAYGGPSLCWGYNGMPPDNYRLGANIIAEDSPLPVKTVMGEGFSFMTNGPAGGCGFTSGGRVYCWGLNDEGQIGDGTTVNRLVPVKVKAPFIQ